MNQTLKRVLGEDGDGQEESREVQIGREILAAAENLNTASTSGGLVADIVRLAQELITMHSQAAGQPAAPAAAAPQGKFQSHRIPKAPKAPVEPEAEEAPPPGAGLDEEEASLFRRMLSQIRTRFIDERTHGYRDKQGLEHPAVNVDIAEQRWNSAAQKWRELVVKALKTDPDFRRKYGLPPLGGAQQPPH